MASSDGEDRQQPDDTILLDLLAERASDEKMRNGILVDNPAGLYGLAT